MKNINKIIYNRKYFVHGDTLLITSRVEEGLPLPPNHVINEAISGILARACELYDVRVCHFVFMSNHFHLMLVVDNPDHVSDFVGYVKGELAHVVNRLMGRRRKTIWASGYDSPKFLQPCDIAKYIKYIYLNPAKANLVKSISEYPGVNSWEAFVSGRHRIKGRKISRDSFKKLPSSSLSVREQREMVASLRGLKCEFELEPNAWAEGFDIDVEEFNRAVIDEVKQEQRALEKKRREENKEVVGGTSLRRQSMAKEHTPKTHSKKLTCICSDIELRIQFLSYYKFLCEQAWEVYQKWKQGAVSERMPAGMFSPRVPTLCSALGNLP